MVSRVEQAEEVVGVVEGCRKRRLLSGKEESQVGPPSHQMRFPS